MPIFLKIDHDGEFMSNSIIQQALLFANQSIPPGPGADPYFSNVVSLLHFDEPLNQITDVIPSRLWGVIGIGTIPPIAGINGTAKHVNEVWKTLEHPDLDMGTGDWTLELAFNSENATQSTYGVVVGSNAFGWGPNRWLLGTVTGQEDHLGFYDYEYYTANNAPALIFPLAVNTWVGSRIAISKNGTTLRGFIDGVMVGEVTGYTSSINLGFNDLIIGYSDINSVGSSGFIDEFRITKGVGRYTANYTPDPFPFPNN